MCYANPTKANYELGWEAKFGIDRMCERFLEMAK